MDLFGHVRDQLNPASLLVKNRELVTCVLTRRDVRDTRFEECRWISIPLEVFDHKSSACAIIFVDSICAIFDVDNRIILSLNRPEDYRRLTCL